MTDLLEKLDACDQIYAVKVTDRRREVWLTEARPGDRWGVSVVGGGTFSYGRSFEEAFRPRHSQIYIARFSWRKCAFDP